MARTGHLPSESNGTWTYALLGGLLSAPLVAAGYWQSGSELSLSPVVLGGILAGYLAHRQRGDSRGVGVRTGLIGGLPALWMLFDVVSAASGLAGPSWFMAVGTVFAGGVVVVIAVVAFGLSALAGEVGARIGGWLVGRTDRRRPPAAG